MKVEYYETKILDLPFVVQTQSCFNEWDQLLHFSFAFFNFVPRLVQGESQCSCKCAHQGDLLWLFPQACYPSNKPISILLSSETDYKFKSKKTAAHSQWASEWCCTGRLLTKLSSWKSRGVGEKCGLFQPSWTYQPTTGRSWEKAEEEEEKAGMVSAPPFIQWQQRRMIFLSISFLTAHLPHLGDYSK